MNIDQLRQELTQFFKSEDFTLEQLVGGASRRKFFRIDFLKDSYFPVTSVVLMIIPQDAGRTFHDYVYLDYYFKRLKVSRPSVYEVSQERGWVFMDFVADPTVEQFLHTQPGKVLETLSRMVEVVHELQRKCRPERGCPAFQRRFDAEKYRFEFTFHLKGQLLEKYFALNYDPKAVDFMVETISQSLDLKNEIFVHRDFQSSNVFINPES
ncbi:MAG TPA: phosphotransferase, partial [Calditrichia bacterium]|nr:phosphotransferase [Calditrichia bacterium]HQV34649.1 phosphotransferase [Calditrichia bacterium]